MANLAKWRRHNGVQAALARELDLQRKLLYTSKYQFEGRPEPQLEIAIAIQNHSKPRRVPMESKRKN